jgi:hypothetical protein
MGSELRALLDNARHDLPDQRSLSHFQSRLDVAIAANKPVPNIDWSQAGNAATATAGKGVALIAGVVGGGLVLSGILAVGLGSGLRGKGPSVEAAASVVASAAPTETNDSSTSTGATAPTAASPSIDEPSTRRAVSDPQPRAKNEPSSASRVSPTAKSEASNLHEQRPETDQGASAAAAAPVTAPTPTTSAPSEASLLTQARAALGGDPERALALTNQHAQRFPNGVLAQEREVIAIAALRALGRSDAANRRGTLFEQRYPGSAHRSKVEQTLKGKSP